MRSKILLVLLPTISLVLSGCVASVERQIVWAQMGTPARIVDQRPVKVLIAGDQDGWLPGSGRLAGMVAIDEPTLRYYQDLDRAASGTGSAQEAP